MLRRIAIGLLLAAPAVPAAPLSTAFTYQGELYDTGVPAEGSFDLRITPYADAGSPAALATPLIVQDVLVEAGTFTAKVDFGAGFFVGDAVYLEIAVRDAGSGDPNDFETLAPRQEITPAPYALKTAPGSVTDLEIAPDAVGNAQVQPDAITGPQIVDGSVQGADVDAASFDPTFWRVGGNTGAGGNVLGVSGSTRLRLQSPSGVEIGGSAFNNSTELTLRGNSGAVETNADLTLWPRGGQFFWNLSAVGTSELDSRFILHSVDADPFTSYVPRFTVTSSGTMLVGNNATSPHAGAFVFADASGGGIASTAANQFVVRAAGGVGVNTAPLSSEYELSIVGTSANATDDVQLALRPRAPDQNRGWALRASKQSGQTQLSFDYSSPSQGIVEQPQVTFSGLGAVGIGAAANAAHAGSFVFADASSTTPLATTAANQMLLRPSGGIGIHRPAGAGDELAIGPREGDPGESADFVLGAAGTVGNFRTSTTVAGAADTIGRYMIRNTTSGFANSPVFEIITEGAIRRLGLFRGRTDGTWVDPAFPIHVGDPLVANSGNGAHLTNGGVWTNGSSRTFKHAFTAIDAGDVLRRVLALDITRWRYTAESEGWHLGPIAEDFHAAFGLGTDERYIGTVDADGVALAAIQGLNARLEAENTALRESLASLAARLDALEQAPR